MHGMDDSNGQEDSNDSGPEQQNKTNHSVNVVVVL